MRFEITLKAQNDIIGLQEFGNANFGVQHTRAYLVGLTQSFKNIRTNPALARLREEYGRTVRVHVYKGHTIFYRFEIDVVRILRVLSRHQNWPDHI